MKNKIFNLIIILLSIFIFLYFFLHTKGLNNLMVQLKSLNLYWILAAVILMILFWLFETLTLYVITKTLCNTRNLFIKTLRFQMIGQFFGSITPFYSGCQPAQVLSMKENEIPPGIASSILMIKFIIHQILVIFYLVIALLFKFNYFNSKISFFFYVCIFGFIIHTAVIVVAFLFSINSTLTKKLLTFIVKILEIIKIVKNKEKVLKKVESELELFHENASVLTKHVKMCVYGTTFTFLQWLAYFTVPYCIFRSLGFNTSDIWTMIAGQIFLSNFMSIIPLPGAVGGAEGGFYVIYKMFFRTDTIMIAILIWRILTYYLSIIVSCFFTLVLPKKYNVIKN